MVAANIPAKPTPLLPTTVKLTVAGQSLPIEGRTAALVVLLALRWQEQINRLTHAGQLQVDFVQGKIVSSLRETGEPAHWAG